MEVPLLVVLVLIGVVGTLNATVFPSYDLTSIVASSVSMVMSGSTTEVPKLCCNREAKRIMLVKAPVSAYAASICCVAGSVPVMTLHPCVAMHSPIESLAKIPVPSLVSPAATKTDDRLLPPLLMIMFSRSATLGWVHELYVYCSCVANRCVTSFH
jgi:hypothetical protein